VSRAVAIGDALRLAGYALAGVEVVEAAAVDDAVARLPGDVALVILDREPDAAVRAALDRRPGLLWCALTA
jgi:hypothetical protein